MYSGLIHDLGSFYAYAGMLVLVYVLVFARSVFSLFFVLESL